MARHKDEYWNLSEPIKTWEEVHVAVLMDIRDELKDLNRLLHCENFKRIPFVLDRIRRNTVKPKRKKNHAKKPNGDTRDRKARH